MIILGFLISFLHPKFAESLTRAQFTQTINNPERVPWHMVICIHQAVVRRKIGYKIKYDIRNEIFQGKLELHMFVNYSYFRTTRIAYVRDIFWCPSCLLQKGEPMHAPTSVIKCLYYVSYRVLSAQAKPRWTIHLFQRQLWRVWNLYMQYCISMEQVWISAVVEKENINAGMDVYEHLQCTFLCALYLSGTSDDVSVRLGPQVSR